MSEAARHTLLVVDDEPEILETVKRTLRREPYDVLTTTSPLEALALLARGGIDLVVSDIDMPEMSGLELVGRVRRDHPDVVRVLLTGAASVESALRAINEGEVHRYFTKPWDKEELRGTLRAALGRLGELRRVAAADRAEAAREEVLVALEREHPGIRDVLREDGVYVVDPGRVVSLGESTMTPRLRSLFREDGDAGSDDEGGACHGH